MKLLTKILTLLTGIALSGFSQVGDADFRTLVTLHGQNHNLYELLESGKSVYFQGTING